MENNEIYRRNSGLNNGDPLNNSGILDMNNLTYFSTFSGIGGFELGIEHACKRKKKDQSVSAMRKSINTPKRSTKPTSQITTTSATSVASTQTHSQTLNSLLEAFRVRPFPLPASAKDSTTHVAISFLKSRGLLGKSNHAFYCLKTSEGFYLTTRGVRSLPSSPRWMSWGTTANGRCLTAKITEPRKTGSGSSLWDIAEKHSDQAYFLSKNQMRTVVNNATRKRFRRAKLHSR